MNGEKRELIVKAMGIRGNRETDKGDSYTFSAGARVVAVIPKAQVLFIEQISLDADE